MKPDWMDSKVNIDYYKNGDWVAYSGTSFVNTQKCPVRLIQWFIDVGYDIKRLNISDGAYAVLYCRDTPLSNNVLNHLHQKMFKS